MLDTLRSGSVGVQRGLSDRVNFEVTLLKASEQSRSGAIDSVIKSITKLSKGLPDSEVKKSD